MGNPLDTAQQLLTEVRDDDISMKHYRTAQAIAQQWKIEKFRERFGKPLFKGVFHDASMLRIEAIGGTFLKKGFPQTPSKDF